MFKFAVVLIVVVSSNLALAQESFIVPQPGSPAQLATPPQVASPTPAAEPADSRSAFKSALLASVQDARRSGKISFRDSIKIRIACISPAFVERAQQLAVTQLAFSGETSDYIPTSEDGMIQVDGIDWQGLSLFLESLVPLLITLLKAFGL